MRIKMLLFCAAVGLVMVGCGDKTEESKEVSKWEDGFITVQTEETSQNNTAKADNEKNKKRKRMTIEEMCENVLNGIQAEDTEALKSLFCDGIQNTHDLDAELAEFYDFVDGKFVYFTDYHSGITYGNEYKEHVFVRYHISCRINVAKTDTDKKYEIEFFANLVQDYEPDKIGVEYILIKNESGEEFMVGDYIGD